MTTYNSPNKTVWISDIFWIVFFGLFFKCFWEALVRVFGMFLEHFWQVSGAILGCFLECFCGNVWRKQTYSKAYEHFI